MVHLPDISTTDATKSADETKHPAGISIDSSYER